MPRVSTLQLRFQWPGKSPEEMKRRNHAATLESIKQRYPMTQEEADALPERARLARFVNFDECETCNFGPYDHTDAWTYPQPVCLKDLARLGLWAPEKEHARREGALSAKR